MNNLREALIDIATTAFEKHGHPDFRVYQTVHSYNHWQVDYRVRNKNSKSSSLQTEVFGVWHEEKAKQFLSKKLEEYLLD